MYNKDKTLRELKNQRKWLERELISINKAIFSLEPLPQFMEWKEKAIKYITTFKCYSQTSEILRFVFENNPEILEDIILRKRYTTALSVALNDLFKVGEIKKFRLYRIKGGFYGLPEWFNKDNTLKEKYFSKKMKSINSDINMLLMN